MSFKYKRSPDSETEINDQKGLKEHSLCDIRCLKSKEYIKSKYSVKNKTRLNNQTAKRKTYFIKEGQNT